MKAAFLSLALIAMMAGASIAEAQRGGGPRPPGPGFPGPGGPGQQVERVRVTIPMYDQQYNAGPANYILVRELIRQQRPQMQLNRYRLESVTLAAKSRQGQGQLTLMIDGGYVSSGNVPGRPNDWNNSHPVTYSTIHLRNQSENPGATWRVEVRGNVRVRELTAVLVEMRGPGGGPGGPGGPGLPSTRVVNVAEDRFDKVIPDMNVHNVRVDNVRELRVSTLEKPIRIHELAVTFANGASQRFEINTDIVRGRDLRLQMGGRDIRTIRIIGTSLDLFGSRANYKIEAVVTGR